MLILYKNNSCMFPYTLAKLYLDNPDVSFPENPSEAVLESYGVYKVAASPVPAFNPKTQRVEEGSPICSNGSWVQTWKIVSLTADEQAKLTAEHTAEVEGFRRAAYQQEADPLFFMVQRGEATNQQWLDKLAEIKARYPY